jgi:hypothetical protein
VRVGETGRRSGKVAMRGDSPRPAAIRQGAGPCHRCVGGDIATEVNKQLVRRVIDEIWSQGHLDRVDELYAPDSRCHAEPGEDRIGR